MSDMEYSVNVRDVGRDSLIIAAKVDYRGLHALLEKFTDLDRDKRVEFGHSVEDHGTWNHYTSEHVLSATKIQEELERILIDWAQIEADWVTHWRNRPSDVDLEDSFNQFWEDRGGRDKYVTVSPNGTLIPNVFKSA